MQIENQIRDRMIKKAAELWEVSPNDIDSTFDPIVTLLINACAYELSKISSEVSNSQNRIAEKLIELMSPESFAGSEPAHAIASAIPVESFSSILPANQLTCQIRNKNSDGKFFHNTVYLSPIKEVKLIRNFIKYAVSENQINCFNDYNKLIETGGINLKNESKLDYSTLFLGIPKMAEKVSLKHTNLFFELNDTLSQNHFYNQLKLASFYYNDNLIDIDFGFQNLKDNSTESVDNIFSEKSQKNISIENQTTQIYKKHYVTFLSDCWLNDNTTTSSEILEKVNLEKHNDFKDMQWIKIVFPKTIDSKILANVYTAVNTFPVLNRRLESSTYRMKEFTTLIPFETSDFFLDIKNISNEKGNIYRSVDSKDNKQKGTYFLRDDNVGRLNSKKAKDYLKQLIELLRDESAAFTSLDNDVFQNNIQKLNQNISLLTENVRSMNTDAEKKYYVSLKPYSKIDIITVDFWSTIGENANLIKANTKLNVYTGTDLNTDKCFLVTPTLQGKNILTTDERLLKYKKSLLSRGRVVTREDVKVLCYDICGNKIESVILTKEFLIHSDYKKGLIPTIVVNLKKNNLVKVKEIEWNMLKNIIMNLLEEKSANTFPYYIKITN